MGLILARQVSERRFHRLYQVRIHHIWCHKHAKRQIHLYLRKYVDRSYPSTKVQAVPSLFLEIAASGEEEGAGLGVVGRVENFTGSLATCANINSSS